MAQHNHFAELGERPVGALLLQYSLPAIIAMVASSLYNIVDAIFIGQSVGKFAIAGLALTNPLMALTAAFGAMVGVGGSTPDEHTVSDRKTTKRRAASWAMS